MNKRNITALLLCFLLLSGCGAAGETAGSAAPGTSELDSVSAEISAASEEASATDPEQLAARMEEKAKNTYNEIMASDYIETETAYLQLSTLDTSDEDILELTDTLSELNRCGGRFIYYSEDTDTNYTADVVFYLKKGQIYCNIDYTGYMGTLGDGKVAPTEKKDYLFESFPEGQFAGKTQDFQIHFGENQLHIAWADTCEYTLTRGSGSAAELDNPEKPFEQTSLYETLDSALSETFDECDHAIWYDESKDCVNIAIEAPGENGALRDLLTSKKQSGLDAWNELIDPMTSLAETLGTIVSVGTGPRHTDLYMVDRLHDDNEYSKNEYLLWIQDGKVTYNYAEDVGGKYASASGISDENDTDTKAPAKTPASSTGSATMGQSNALKRAKEYLEYMPFSYSGLIDQLEFEGYSYSEAEYAADNCGADWNEQAALKAADYLDFMSFSRSELIDQLEFEGFTYEQAVYGAKQNGY